MDLLFLTERIIFQIYNILYYIYILWESPLTVWDIYLIGEMLYMCNVKGTYRYCVQVTMEYRKKSHKAHTRSTSLHSHFFHSTVCSISFLHRWTKRQAGMQLYISSYNFTPGDSKNFSVWTIFVGNIRSLFFLDRITLNNLFREQNKRLVLSLYSEKRHIFMCRHLFI